MGRRTNLIQAVNLKIKQCADLGIVRANEGLSQSSLVKHFIGLEQQSPSLNKVTKTINQVVIMAPHWAILFHSQLRLSDARAELTQSPFCLSWPDSLQRLSTVPGVWGAFLGCLCGIQTIMDQAWDQEKEVSLPSGIKTGSHLSGEPINQWFSNVETQRSYLWSLLKCINPSYNKKGDYVCVLVLTLDNF